MATTLLYYSFQSPMILLVPKMYVFFYKKQFQMISKKLFHVLFQKTSTIVNKYRKNQRKKIVTEYFLSYLVKGLFNNGRLGTQNQPKNAFKSRVLRQNGKIIKLNKSIPPWHFQNPSLGLVQVTPAISKVLSLSFWINFYLLLKWKVF